MNRPIPVVLTAIFLGLLAALKLLGAAGIAAVGIFVLRRGLPGPPTPSPLPPSFLPILFFGMALLAAAAAVWSILTLIGLLRLRSWARYSVLVLAGCITLFAGMGMLMSFAMPFLLPNVATQTPAPDSHVIRGIFLFIGAIYGLFTAIGIALLVYYNLAKTRVVFLQNAPISFDQPNTSTGRPRPTAITVLSWFLLISGPFCAIYACFPLPAFLFGFTFYGMAGHIVYATFGLISLTIGYGLLRLRPEARIAIIAWVAVGFVNVLAILTPWGARNFRLYMDKFTFHSPGLATPNPLSYPGLVAVSLVFGAAFNIFVLWLLHRHREAFTPAPSPPPPPSFSEPLAGLTP